MIPYTANQNSTTWQARAECLDEDPDLFFTSTASAKTVCRRCPVLDQCREWALDRRIEFGVWGGLSEAERRAILRKRGRGTGTGRKKALA
ncbi:WhiB family transcriptional regulator [Streptomyces hygroscopicus]|uniref:WhiB family transcriptional regulator n=1 Tax=Streptomyces hygroscopicus TaxID=1912 RepID=UPI0033FF37B3